MDHEGTCKGGPGGCPWLIRKFVDSQAEFYFVPADDVMNSAKQLEAIPFDVPKVELGHHGKE